MQEAVGAASDEAQGSVDDLGVRRGIIEAQLRVQQRLNEASGGTTPALATAIRALRMLNVAGNASKHSWTAQPGGEGRKPLHPLP